MMRIKNFCNKLFICFLLMLLVTGCGTEETADNNYIEEETEEVSDEKIEEEQPEEIETSKDSVETEEEIQSEEEETDRGVESPLAVYAVEQLGREIEGCHEADYDQDGENEVIFSVEIERTDEKELDKLEIYFVDDDYEMTMIDTHEVGLYEDQLDREDTVWNSEGDALMDYHGAPVFIQNLLLIGSVGPGFHRWVYYGWTGKEIVKLEECEGWGLSVTTYLYDGSISPVTDRDFLKICNGDFSGVTGREENLIENLENWYKNRRFSEQFDYYLECDVDHDGTNELYMADRSGESAAVFHKGEEGIECWVYGSTLALSDNGNFWYEEETWETNGRWHEECRTNTVISFDSNGNQDVMEYKEVTVLYEKSSNKEDWTIFDKCALPIMRFYYRNGNPVTEKEYYESMRESKTQNINENDSINVFSESDANVVKKDESGKEYYGMKLGLYWECTYIQMKDIPHADAVNEQIKSEVSKELEDLMALSTNFPDDDIEPEMMGSNGRAWLEARVYTDDIIYQSDRYLAIGTTIHFRQLWTGVAEFNRKHKIICFDLEKGEIITLEDISGVEYTKEELEELVWIGYEKLVEKEGDKYNKEFFNQYYEKRIYWTEWYTGTSENGGYEEKALDELIHYYFSEEGIVFYFNNYWVGIPAESGEYVVGIHLSDPKETELRITIPWEEIF